MEEKKDEFNFEEFEKQAIEMLYEKKPLTGSDGVLTPLIKRLLERRTGRTRQRNTGYR